MNAETDANRDRQLIATAEKSGVALDLQHDPPLGPEALSRLRAGRAISYCWKGMLVEEFPDGRRYEIRVEPEGATTLLREL